MLNEPKNSAFNIKKLLEYMKATRTKKGYIKT